MSRKFAQMSALAFVLTAALALPAAAVTEEDAAVPQGAFTSSMTAPAHFSAFARGERHARFAKFRQERVGFYRAHMRQMMARAEKAE